MKRVALILAALGAAILGSASVRGEERGGASARSTFEYVGSERSGGIFFGVTSGGRHHFDHRHPGDRHFHRGDFDRNFHRRDFDGRDFRRDRFDRRDFHHGHFDRRHFPDGDYVFRRDPFQGDDYSRGRNPFYGGRHFPPHDRGHFRGGVIFGDDVRVWRNYDDSATVIIENYPTVGIEEDSRTTTYRGSESTPDDPGSRTTTYRGGGRTLGNLPGR